MFPPFLNVPLMLSWLNRTKLGSMLFAPFVARLSAIKDVDGQGRLPMIVLATSVAVRELAVGVVAASPADRGTCDAAETCVGTS